MADKSKKVKKISKLAIYELPNDSIVEIPLGREKYMFPMEIKPVITTDVRSNKEYISEKGISILDRHGGEILSCFTVYDNRLSLSDDNKLTDKNIYEFYSVLPTDIGRVNLLVKNESRKAELNEKNLDERVTDIQTIINNLREDLVHIPNKTSINYLQTEAQLEEVVEARKELRMERKECENLREGLSALNEDLVYILSLKEEQDRIKGVIRERTIEDTIKKLADSIDKEDFKDILKSTELAPEQVDYYSKIFSSEKQRLNEKEKSKKMRKAKIKDANRNR